MKKLVLSILAIFIIGLFVACNQDVTVDAQIHDATHGHTDITYFSIQSDGSWKCKYCDYILPGTESPYITVLNDGYPTEIIPLTSTTDVGYGTVTIEGDSVTYSNASGNGQDVVIRTNSASTSLTIDAAADTVKHYGAVGSLNIIAVANMSYHEYGQVAFAEISTGRIVLESESKVEHVHLTATNGNFVDITVAKANDVEMPEFSRDPVEIPAEGKLVVALQEGTKQDDNKEYVWLTAVGIYEQVTVSDSKTEAGTTYASQTGTNEQKEAAQQIANNITFSEGGVDYKVTATKDGDGWKYEVKTEAGVATAAFEAAESGNTVTITNVSTSQAFTPTTENGLSEEQKESAKNEVVNEAISKEIEASQEYVAKVGDDFYTDALTAFKVAATDNEVVYILRDCSVELEKLPDDVDFDLNGHTLTKIFDATDAVNSLEGSDIYVDVWKSWGMEGMEDADGNECPQYLLVTDTHKYRDLGVKEGEDGDWISGQEIAEYFAGNNNYTYIYHMYEVEVSVSTFDGNTTAFKYFANGNGSQAKPYIIENVEQFKNMGKLSDYIFVDEDENVLSEKKNTKTYYINVTTDSLDFSGVSTAIWQFTAASPYIEASGFNVNIDFNDCEIKGKDLTFGSTGKYEGQPLYDPNFGISYAAGYYLGYVYDRAYSVTIKNAKFTNCGVNAENGVSLTLDNCSFDFSSYSRLRSYQNKVSTAGAVNHIIKDCKFNNCYIEFGGGSGSSYEINTQFINCEFTKEKTGGYNPTVKYDSYTYGNLSFDGCTMTVNLGQNYNPIKIETNQSYIGEHSVSLTIKDTTINWTSAIGTYDSGIRVPVSKGIATIIEQGTNSYIVNETALNYDGSAIGE